MFIKNFHWLWKTSLFWGMFFCSVFFSFADSESGIAKIDYFSPSSEFKTVSFATSDEEKFVNANAGILDIFAYGISGTKIQLFDGSTLIKESEVLTSTDNFVVGGNVFSGKKLTVNVLEGVHFFSTKVVFSDGNIYKTYNTVKVVQDVTPPVVKVYNGSNNAGDQYWIGFELAKMYATASDTLSGINSDISSVRSVLKNITTDTLINKPGDTITFANGQFFFSPQNGFYTGTFVNGNIYEHSFTIADKAGNTTTASRSFQFDNVLNFDKFFKGMLGIYDPNNPACATNNQCKSGGTYPGYMPYISGMTVYTNPTHLIFQIDKNYISKWQNGSEMVGFGDMILPWTGYGWYEFDTTSGVWNDVLWYNEAQGIVKTNHYLKPMGYVGQFLYFRDSAYNRTTPSYPYVIDASAGGKPPIPRINALSTIRLSLSDTGTIPSFSGTNDVINSPQTISVRQYGNLSNIYSSVVVPAGQSSWTTPENLTKTFPKNGLSYLDVCSTIGSEVTCTGAVLSIYSDETRPVLDSINITEGKVFQAQENVIIDMVAKDLPFGSSLIGTFKLDYTRSFVEIKKQDGTFVTKSNTTHWKNNNDASHRFSLDVGTLPEGKYTATIHLVDNFGNAMENDVIRNFTIDSSAPLIEVKNKLHDSILTNGEEIFSLNGLEFHLTDTSGIDFNPNKTTLKFWKKDENASWIPVSIAGFTKESREGKIVLTTNATIMEEGEMKFEIQVADILGNVSVLQSGNFYLTPRTMEFESNDLFFTGQEEKIVTSKVLSVGESIITGSAPVLCIVPERSEVQTIIVNGVACNKHTWTTVFSNYNFSSTGRLSFPLQFPEGQNGTGELLISISNSMGLFGRLRLVKSEISFETPPPYDITGDGASVLNVSTNTILAPQKVLKWIEGEKFTLPESITDIFLYEVMKESNTVWRSDASKSWFSETKDDAVDGICDFMTGDGDGDPRNGSDDRCGLSAFPEKALLVATENHVYIFDATRQKMWMKFDEAANGSKFFYTTYSNNSVFALNGKIYVGSYAQGGENGNLTVLGFGDDNKWYYKRDGYQGKVISTDRLSQRNNATGWGTINQGQGIINSQVRDVYARTINGKNYVAVATDGGVSLINETDGTVNNFRVLADASIAKNVFLKQDGTLYYSDVHAGNAGICAVKDAISKTGMHVGCDMKYGKNADVQTIGNAEGTSVVRFLENAGIFLQGHNGQGTTTLGVGGISMVYENLEDVKKNAVRMITNAFATLPLFGDVRGYWANGLSDNTGAGNVLTNIGNVLLNPVDLETDVYAFEFNRENYLETAARAFDITEKITIGAWIKAKDFSDTHNEILQKMGSFGMRLNGEGRLLGYRWGGPETQVSSPLRANEWYFVAVSFDGKTHKTYVNGVLQNSVADVAAIPSSPNALRIGKTETGKSFNGFVALPFIAAESYSDAQILTVYEQSKNWFAEKTTTTFVGNSDNVLDIACIEQEDICFIVTDDHTVTEMSNTTGVTKKTSFSATKLATDLRVMGVVEDKKLTFQNINTMASELKPIPKNTEFIVQTPSLLQLSPQHVLPTRTDALGKLHFSLQAAPSSVSSMAEVVFFAKNNPDLKGKFLVHIWKPVSGSTIKNGKGYDEMFFENGKTLDKTPDFRVLLVGRNDELSKAVKFRFQIANDSSFTPSSLVYENISSNFSTLNAEGMVEADAFVSKERALQEGNYFARVQSEDEKGRVSFWSSAFPFTIEQDFSPSVPTAVHMKEIASEKEILSGTTLTKNTMRLFFQVTDPNITQKVGYEIQVAHDENFLDMVQTITEATTHEQGSFSHTFSGMVPDAQYYWRVRGVDASGNKSVWSAPLFVKVKIPEPTSFFVQGKDFENYPALPDKKFFSPATLADRYLSFGFTLPSLDPIASFLPAPVVGKTKMLAANPSVCVGTVCTPVAPSWMNISGSSAMISSEKLMGALRIDSGGYIYLSPSAMPDSLRSIFPQNFVGIVNNGKGKFSGKAWSTKHGMVDFGNGSMGNCIQPSSFSVEKTGVCLDDFGKFQGFAHIEHKIFMETELKKLFSDVQWANVQTFFVNGVSSGEKIFHPAVTYSVLNAIENAEVKSQLLLLFAMDGGYIQMSHPDFSAKDVLQTTWRRDGVQVPLEIKSGKSQYAESTIVVNTIPVKSTTKNFVVAQLDGQTWEVKIAQEFDTSTVSGATELKNFLATIPENGVMVLGTYKNPTENLSVFVSEFANFGVGTGKINALTSSSAYVLVARKGAKEPLIEELSEGTLRYLQESEKISKSSSGNLSLLLGTSSSQSLGQVIFSPTGGGAQLSPPPSDSSLTRTGGVVGRLWTEGAGWIFLDADGNFGATNVGDDYGMVITREDTDKNLYFSGKGWGSATGYLEISRGSGMTKCEKVETPHPDHFGVCRDASGAFHGFAWSPSFGWISFESVYSHDPNSSLGFLFEISKDPTFASGVTRYQINKILAGDILLSAREIFESLGKKCIVTDGIYNQECSFPYGSYYWRVQTLSSGHSSFFSPVQSVNIDAIPPTLNHICPSGKTLPMNPEFVFTIGEKNIPTLPVRYSISFKDTAKNPLIIPTIYSGDFSKEYLKENKESMDLSRANGKTINYTVEAINEQNKSTQVNCGEYLIRGLFVTANAPKEDVQTSRSPEFQFEVQTLENDEYDFFLEVREKGVSGTDFSTWTKVAEKTAKKLDADIRNIHNETLSGNLQANKNLCWQVKVVSKDGTEAKSTVECFFTKNEKPIIESVIMKGDGGIVGTEDEHRPGYTSDQTPSFEVKVKDDSSSGDVKMKIFDISSGTPVFVNEFVKNITLTEGKGTAIIDIPEDKKLLEETKNYKFEVIFEDNENMISDPKNGWFVFSPLSNEIGLGNIGTSAILLTDLNNPPHFKKSDHRFAKDIHDIAGNSVSSLGWIDFNAAGGGVYIAPSKVYGYAWNENIGWIRFNCGANPQTKKTFEYQTPMPGVVRMQDLIDTEDSFCKKDGILEDVYGVYPGIVGGKMGDISGNNQDLLGKAKIEAIEENGNPAFLYFDVETLKKDNASSPAIAKWEKNLHGRKAVGIDKDGKLSGFAWSPTFGWVDMGLSEQNANFNVPENKKYFPITEYQPAAATCIPKQLAPNGNTFEASETISVRLAESCEGMKLTGSKLYLREKGNADILQIFSGSCTEKSTCDLLLDDRDYTTRAEKVFEIFGEITQDNGQKLIIPETQPLQYKIIAASEPDFSANGWAKMFISDGNALANNRDTAQMDVVLRDRFGNDIFETTDISGKKAREMDFILTLKNTIRTEQFEMGEWTRGEAVTFLPSLPSIFENISTSLTEKRFSVRNFSNPGSARTSLSMKSLSPTGENDALEISSFGLKISSLLSETPVKKWDKTYLEDTETKKMKVEEKEIFTEFIFDKIFFGESKFQKEFDEVSEEKVPYSIGLKQKVENGGVSLDMNNFHFLHCLNSSPEGLLSFSPIQYSGVENEGQNCYEVSKGTASSRFEADVRKGKVIAGKEATVEAKNNLPFTPDHITGTNFSFSSLATRISMNSPERVIAELYVAFQLNGKWVRYPIENKDTSATTFVTDEGFVVGSTSGARVYADTVSNRDEGNFFHTEGAYSIEEVRNALYKSLVQFRNEKQGMVPLENSQTIEIPSTDLSNWLKNDDTSGIEQSVEGKGGHILYNGDVIWIEFDADSSNRFVVLGNGDSIDDWGGNEIGKKTSKTIVVVGGNVEIADNIFRRYEGTLGIIALRRNEHLQSSSQVQLSNSGNILIDTNVTNIRSVLYADGSILSYNPLAANGGHVYDGFDSRETRTNELFSQIYFLGSIMAQNTYGGSFAPDMQMNGSYLNALHNRPVWHSSGLLNYADSEIRKKESIRFDLKRLRDFRRIAKYSDDVDGNGVKDSEEDEDGNCSSDTESCKPEDVYYDLSSGNIPAYENFVDISLLDDSNRGWNIENSSGKKARSAVIFEYDEQIQKNPPPGTVVFNAFQVNQ